MNNLGGHDLPSILEAFDAIDHDRPTCFIAYTVKGFGLPMAGHKDNHAGLMTPAQMESFRKAMDIRPGHEWDRFEGLSVPPDRLQAFLDRVPFAKRGHAPTEGAAARCAGRAAGHHAADDVDADRLRRSCSTRWRGRRRPSRIASSPPRLTSRSRPISGHG